MLTTNEVINFTSKQLSPELLMILNNAGYSIRIEIRAGGSLAEIYDPKTGRTVGGLSDLSHFAGARKFVADERKKTSSEGTLDEQGAIVLFLAEKIRKTDANFKVPSVLSSEFLLYLKMTATKIKVVQENIEEISKFPISSLEEKTAKLILQKMAGLIVQARLTALQTFLHEGKLDKDFLTNESLKLGIPKWFTNKLETKLPVMSEPDIRRVLYPQSAKGWVSLTFKEWRSEAVLNNLEHLLCNSGWLLSLLTSDKFVRQYCGIEPSVCLSDYTVPLVAKLSEGKVCIVPHCIGYDFAFEPISKNKDQGFWALPRFDNPSNALTSLSQAMVRSLLGFVNYSDVITSFWNDVFPEVVIERPKITKANNIQRIALLQATDTIRLAYIDRLVRVETDKSRALMCRLLADQTMAGPQSPQRKAFEDHLSPKGKSFVEIPNTGSNYKAPSNIDELISSSDVKARLRNLFDTTSSEERKGAINDTLNSFPKKKEKDKQTNLMVRSALGKKAQSFLLKDLKGLKNPVLQKKMDTWFRAFIDVRMQDAAVAYLQAQFDELFTRQLVASYDKVDEDASSDEDDDSDED